MNIVIPMAGEGKRFAEEGYKVSKPAIPTVDRKTGREMPMVACAVSDLPGVEQDGSNVVFIDRDFHKTDGVEDVVLQEYPKARFITIDHLTEGQACTCMLAVDVIDKNEELLIAGCDNGMVMKEEVFNQLRTETDCIVFTFRHNESVLKNPNAYGWMITDENDNIVGTSIKKAVSDTPMNDHAVVATFWFRKAQIFIDATNKMITENDRINNEFYVDQVVKHVLDLGYRAKVFDIDRYICWGTPKDFEEYTKTIRYWEKYVKDELLKHKK